MLESSSTSSQIKSLLSQYKYKMGLFHKYKKNIYLRYSDNLDLQKNYFEIWLRFPKETLQESKLKPYVKISVSDLFEANNVEENFKKQPLGLKKYVFFNLYSFALSKIPNCSI